MVYPVYATTRNSAGFMTPKLSVTLSRRVFHWAGTSSRRNAPFIVFDDADLDAAVAGAVASKFRNSGQTCICANRILVQDSIHDAFASRLVEAVGCLELGPLIHGRAVEGVERLVADAVASGARVLCGGSRRAVGDNHFAATVLADVTPGMACARREIFGPVAPLIRFAAEEDAIHLANDTPYGLAAYAYTRDGGRCGRLAERLKYGIIGLNEAMVSTEVSPFGGMKESGLGREGSKYGIDEYLEIKYVCQGG